MILPRRHANKHSRIRLLGATVLMVTWATSSLAADAWTPFPPTVSFSDFGGVGLIQTPSSRFAPDGQMSVGANHVWPYDRYYFTVQGTPWLEATLRLTTVRNRLYSPFPEFSGNQSYKDRGFDVKVKILDEGRLTPSLAFGLRDFVGTGLFSSEYFVTGKRFGPLDVSLGVGWGNLATRGELPNPFRLISSRFDDRGAATAGGGSTNGSYFKGRNVGVFGGFKYDSPIKGMTVKAEYDPNDYKQEALGNQFRTKLPVNFGVDYQARSWLRVGAAFERGNEVGLNLTLTTNFNKPFRIPKFDPPATPVAEVEKAKLTLVEPATQSQTQSAPTSTSPQAATAELPLKATSNGLTSSRIVVADEAQADGRLSTDELGAALTNALGVQGAGLYSADLRDHEVVLYVAQGRFTNMATGVGRIARAAFSALPSSYGAVQIVFVENGIETIAIRVYRQALLAALTAGRGSAEELLGRTDFTLPPLDLAKANYQSPIGKAPPRFFYSIRPFLTTTLGRPEQFLLYETGVRFNGFVQVNRNLNVQGSIAVDVADNFDKLRIPSNSTLPHVRSDIKDYLREGKTALSTLSANYVFDIAPDVYGHVFAGLLEQMYGGAGGEILYRPSLSNWALGADLSYVKKRGFDQRFDFLNYSTVTGFVTGAYYFPGANIDVRVRLGRYLAKDYGGTFEIARTFDSGVVIGAFATKTNVSAADFGEGRFDKGIFVSLPLDAIYTRHVRGNVGLTYRPLIRDGGQMLSIPEQLLGTTDDTIRAKFRRDWDGVTK